MSDSQGFDLRRVVETFVAESNERLDAMEEALLALEEHPGADVPLRELFRAVHTLKGDSGSLGLDDIQTLAHRGEDLLGRALAERRALTPRAIQALLAATDHFRRRLADIEAADLEIVSEAPPSLVLDQLERADLGEAASAAASTHDDERTGAIRSGDASVRVAISRLDRLFDLAGEVLIARGRLRDELSRLPPGVADRAVSELESTIALERELQEMLLAARLVPLGPVLRGLQRLVRDTAGATGKRVRLEVDDAGVDLDARVAEVLRGPLSHLVRNAIDHGIESPERRQAAGKPSVGRLRMAARHRGGAIQLVVEDDGAGLDLERIRARGVAEGLIAADAEVDDAMLAALVTAQGFSTAAEVTEISGRGVGLDAVAECARLLDGKLELDNRPGKGLSVALEFPLTVAIVDTFGVEVGGTALFVPESVVVGCLPAPPAAVGGGRATYLHEHEGEPLPVVDLGVRLGLGDDVHARAALLVVTWRGRHYGLAVDRLDGLAPRIAKPLSSSLAGGFGYVGGTVLADGRVGLILDLRSVLEPFAAGPARTATTSTRTPG
jgi:two-component system chemotaxis sensor kinase CheA